MLSVVNPMAAGAFIVNNTILSLFLLISTSPFFKAVNIVLHFLYKMKLLIRHGT